MKSAERLQKMTDDLVNRMNLSEFETEDLIQESNQLLNKLRKSRWEDRFEARMVIYTAIELLQNRKRLRLIQGGNDFLARRSKAVLTLINCEQINVLNKRGA